MKQLFTLLSLLFISTYSFAQWTSEDSGMPGTKSLVDIYAADSNVVWGAGAFQPFATGVWSNDFCRTVNGGTTWTAGTIAAANGYSMSNIWALDGNTAWVCMYNPVAAGGRVYKTVNGGTTWTQELTTHFTSSTSFPDFIYFKNANDGVVLGDPIGNKFEIYTTNDGGTTWTAVPGANMANAIGTEYGLTAAYSVVGNNIWFGSTSGRVWHSPDFGQHWTAATTGSNYIQSVAFKNNVSGLALDSSMNLYATADAGLTWNPVGASGGNYSFQIKYVPGTAGTYMGVGRDATALQGSAISTDDGQNWTTLDLGIYHNAITCINGNNIWSGGFRDSSNVLLDPGVYKYSGMPIVTVPTIVLTYPNGGDTLYTGNAYNITWTSTGITNVQLEYSTNNGAVWNNISATTANNNTYNWSVPTSIANSSTCRVRVSDASASTTNSMSAAAFTIMSQPNGISNIDADKTIQLYPMPCTVSCLIHHSNMIKQIAITDVLGRNVNCTASTIDSNNIEINTSELPAGVYFLQIDGKAFKLVKE